MVLCQDAGHMLLGEPLVGLDMRHAVATWWTRAARSIVNAGMRLFGRDYRFFVHDPLELLQAARAHGHALVERRRFGVWSVAVLERG